MAFLAQSDLPARVFINYAHSDMEIAQKLARELSDKGATVWIDTENIKGGDKWLQAMNEGIQKSQFLIAVITERSVSPEREQVLHEQNQADLLLKELIPCIFHDDGNFFKHHSLPTMMIQDSAIDFGDWETGFRKLADSIKTKLFRPGECYANHAERITSPFIGRQNDLKKLNEHILTTIQKPTSRQPIAISAAGGMGKTMLAQELVRRLSYHFPGGTILEERGSNQTKAAVILTNWAKKLRPPIDREYSLDEIQELIRDMRSGLSQFGSLLVLIDDVSKTDLQEVDSILDALPVDATVIITTRMSEISPVFFRYKLEPMTQEDAMCLLTSRLRDHFLTEIDPDNKGLFDEALNKYNDSLNNLIALVGSHPLAMDLGIGSCTSLHDIPRVVKKLQQKFMEGVEEFLDKTALSVSDKNKSLGLSLSYSLRELEDYDLAHATRMTDAFCMLGVFPDGADLPRKLLMGVWNIKDLDTAQDVIHLLVSRAMLRVRNNQTNAYYNHPVIRAFATGLLNRRDDSDEVWNRYIEWLIRRVQLLLSLPREKWYDLTSLIAHIEHSGKRLRKKLEDGGVDLYVHGAPQLTELPNDLTVDSKILQLSLEFAHALKEYVVRNPQWGEQGIRCLLGGLVTARILDMEKDEVSFLKRLGGALTKSDPQKASTYFAEALQLAKKHDQPEEISAILSYYGELERTQGNFLFSLELLNEALQLHTKNEDQKMQASTLKYMGEVYWRMSDFTKSFELYGRARDIYRALKDESGEADLLNKIGSVYFNKGAHETAIEYFNEAEQMHLKVGNSSMRAEDINDMGAAYRYLGKRESALQCFDHALEIHDDLSNVRLESLTRSNRTGILCDMGRYKEALEEGQKAVYSALQVGDAIAFVWSYCWLGNAYEGMGKYVDAERCFEESIQACRRTINPRGLAGVLGMYAHLLLKRKGKEAIAKASVDEAIAIMDKHGLKQAFGGKTLKELIEFQSTL